LSPVEILSPAIMGAFSAAADQSPESPRCVETSPRIRLMRAAPGSELCCPFGWGGDCGLCCGYPGGG